MDTISMKNDGLDGNEGMNKTMGMPAALRQLFNMQMSQRFLCGFIVGRIWIRLSIPSLLEVFITCIN